MKKEGVLITKMDLHMHSICSDGERTPIELVELAIQQGLTHMSITDHDAISAYAEAEKYAKTVGIELIPGMEFNTFGPQGEIHILGYGMDVNNERLLTYCKWRKEERKSWSQQIVHKLHDLSYSIQWEDCFARANGAIIVRTHIADELVDKGYFNSSKEAFNSLLQMGRPGYVKRAQFTTKDAIDLIHHCGGIAVVAHPGIYPFKWSLETLIAEGIDGIEAFYSKHELDQTAYWLQQAEHYQLLVSVGSDFHGETSRNPMMIGSVAYERSIVHPWVEALVQRGVNIT